MVKFKVRMNQGRRGEGKGTEKWGREREIEVCVCGDRKQAITNSWPDKSSPDSH